MHRPISAFIAGAVLAACAAIGIALAGTSSATSPPAVPRTGSLPVNRWVAEPGPCPLVFPGTRPSEGSGWPIGPVEVTKGGALHGIHPGLMRQHHHQRVGTGRLAGCA